MRRVIHGLSVRLILSVLISLMVWWLFTTPFDRLPLPRSVVPVIVRVLDFPVALAGEVLPIRGMELVFDNHDTWCDFCQPGEMFRQQMRLAIPVYLLLLYVPNLILSVAHRKPRLFKRIVIGLSIYSAFTFAYFLITSDADRRGDVRIAVVWLLILAAAAAVAWSNMTERLKALGISTVLFAGAWVFVLTKALIAPKIDEVRPYFVSYLVLLIFGVGGTLWLTQVIEKVFVRRRNRRVDSEAGVRVVSVECIMGEGDEKFMKMREDEMELAFITDFVQFGARLSTSTALALLRAKAETEVERKRLAAAILLQLYLALEDFAILLNAMITRRKGLYLHLSMSLTTKQGTTHFPAILKKPVTAQEVFETLGFDRVNVDLLRRLGYEITVNDLDASFGDFAASVKQLGEYVDDYNSLKNRLKHGKAVFGLDFGLEKSADVAHLEVSEEKASPNVAGAPNNLSLEVGFVRTAATDEQVRVRVVTIAKLAKVALDLLAIFVAHYYPEAEAEKVAHLVKEQFDEIVAAVKREGLSSKGLTE